MQRRVPQRKTFWHLADCGHNHWRRSWDWWEVWLCFCLSSLLSGLGKCSMYCGLLTSSQTPHLHYKWPRQMFITKKWVGKAEETFLDQSGKWKVPWDVCFGPVHLHVRLKGTCNILQLLWLHLSNFGLCLWGLVYYLGSGLSSSPSYIQIWSRTCFLLVSPNSD